MKIKKIVISIVLFLSITLSFFISNHYRSHLNEFFYKLFQIGKQTSDNDKKYSEEMYLSHTLSGGEFSFTSSDSFYRTRTNFTLAKSNIENWYEVTFHFEVLQENNSTFNYLQMKELKEDSIIAVYDEYRLPNSISKIFRFVIEESNGKYKLIYGTEKTKIFDDNPIFMLKGKLDYRLPDYFEGRHDVLINTMQLKYNNFDATNTDEYFIKLDSFQEPGLSLQYSYIKMTNKEILTFAKNLIDNYLYGDKIEDAWHDRVIDLSQYNSYLIFPNNERRVDLSLAFNLKVNLSDIKAYPIKAIANMPSGYKEVLQNLTI